MVVVQLPDRYVDSMDPFGEVRSLAETAGAMIVGELMQKRDKPRGKTFLGKGRVEDLTALVQSTGATLVIFDCDLSPAQIRELEQIVRCKVIDRSELILDIFANRATTAAAKLQVEIAQLEYTYPRLRAMWSHLEQIVGGAPVGIGTRGPGEKQIEIDRRLVSNRLKKLRQDLREIQMRKTREVESRRLDFFTVGLVGYTNAGKSTLFNRLTRGGAFADPKLFATLATRVERWELGGGNAAMLSDTVGFIRDLPHHLVASFRSTLEETILAHTLIIVLDVSDRNATMQLKTVHETLDAIGATTQPRLIVLNKSDLIADRRDLLLWLNRYPQAMVVSAATGDGCPALTEAVKEEMLGSIREVQVQAPAADGRSITLIEQRTQVLDRQYLNGEARFTVRLGRRQIDHLLAQGARFRINGLSPMDAIQKLWDGPPPRPAPRVPPHLQP